MFANEQNVLRMASQIVLYSSAGAQYSIAQFGEAKVSGGKQIGIECKA
jgi:hypothetical protein